MKKMEKLVALACTLAMGVSLAACAPSGSGSTPSNTSGSGTPSPAPADKIVLRYADTVNDNDVDGLGAAKFNELVQEATNGQVEIQWYGSGTLGSDIDITQACISGTVDIAKCSSGNLAGFSSALAWTELPGLFNSLEECRNVLNSDIRDTIVETMYNDIGCYPLMLGSLAASAPIPRYTSPLIWPAQSCAVPVLRWKWPCSPPGKRVPLRWLSLSCTAPCSRI